MYYKFNPKNHICSLTWTGLLFASQVSSGGSAFEAVLAPVVMGLPTVFVGINIREKAEKNKRDRIVRSINQNKEVTASEVANLLNLSGSEARNILDSLVMEERIEITNRLTDMKVIYIPAEY
ncbi:hypothetical protein [Myxosarcina sp. GI1]|uniref:hypothetical protein n=1 Tax=Myxosarcina sp. GI1 TaxID=1541065 RepID=UPI0005698FFD|nr:hypothetical protein [Myxosarcina sp. GI1]